MTQPTVATISVTCKQCGTRELMPSGLGITAYSDGRFIYSFFCDKCRLPHSYPLDGKTVDKLVKAGVHLHRVVIPDEWKQSRMMMGKPIDEQDVSNFVLDINTALERHMTDLKARQARPY